MKFPHTPIVVLLLQLGLPTTRLGVAKALNTLSHDVTNVTLDSLVFNDRGRYNGTNRRNGDDDDDDDDDDNDRRPGLGNFGEIPVNRQGFRMQIGTPPQTVWLSPSLILKDVIVRNASSCHDDDDDDDDGLDDTDEYRQAVRLDGIMIRETVSFPNASQELNREGFEVGLHLDHEDDDDDDDHVGLPGFLGLNRESTFLQTFFPNNKVFGVSFPKMDRNWGIEIDFDGGDVAKSTGGIVSTAFPADQRQYPLSARVESMEINGQELLSQPFNARIDIGHLPGTKLPRDVYRRFASVTGANGYTDDDDDDNDWIREASYPTYNTTVPTLLSEQWNLTVRFSNGFETRIPQQYLVQEVNYSDQSTSNSASPRRPRSISKITNVERADSSANGALLSGPTLGSDILLFSYLIVDYQRNQWSIARSLDASRVLGEKREEDVEVPNSGDVPAPGGSSDGPNGAGGVAVDNGVRAVLCMGVLTSLVGIFGLV
ncbi:hypothetical protein TWF569_010143 [Orbilia oligospora]|uniref:Peptidase A1 domain-containing protein n=1 Tax=Orbilia oligospora TaxID=2813651 RepID=A0A7C8PA82_ORBOL|nr:hypothetical protein TWF569_010143 [Orbilia oligospora]KAF3139201.1 hypothetical protein TWF703_004141 [Orbilia oligospora]